MSGFLYLIIFFVIIWLASKFLLTFVEMFTGTSEERKERAEQKRHDELVAEIKRLQAQLPPDQQPPTDAAEGKGSIQP
jgi:hypothetical protein